MRAIGGLLGLVIVAAIGYFIYTGNFRGEDGIEPPKQQIDVTGVRMDLLSLSQAQKRFAALNGYYASLDQLQQAESVPFRGSMYRGYSYEIDTDGTRSFLITARPADPDRISWPVLSIDETGQMTVE